MKRLTLRLKKDLHETLREESFQTKKSLNQIITEAIEEKYKGGNEMKKLLDNKYTIVLELLEETGKIRMENIDDGDLEQLQKELEEEGYETYVDASTDYLIGEKKEMLKFENLMLTHLNEDGTYDLEFQADGRKAFIKSVEAEGASEDEFYFDDEDRVKKIIEEYREDN